MRDVNGGDHNNRTTVMCAIADFEATDYDVILPSHVIREIQQLPDKLFSQSVVNYTPTDNHKETDSKTIQQENIKDTREDDSSTRDKLKVDVPFSGDSGQGTPRLVLLRPKG